MFKNYFSIIIVNDVILDHPTFKRWQFGKIEKDLYLPKLMPNWQIIHSKSLDHSQFWQIFLRNRLFRLISLFPLINCHFYNFLYIIIM